MKRLLLVCALVVGGCAGPVGKMSADELAWGEPVKPVTLPDGRAGFIVSCARGGDYCYERARSVCGGDYEITRRVDPNERVDRSVEIVCKT